jgi:hypothetical protein
MISSWRGDEIVVAGLDPAISRAKEFEQMAGSSSAITVAE